MSITVVSDRGPFAEYPEFHFAPPRHRRGRRDQSVPVGEQRANMFDLAKRDGWSCHYCGADLSSPDGYSGYPDGQSATVDHVVPRRWSGSDTNQNCVLACGGCNTLKGDRVWPVSAL